MALLPNDTWASPGLWSVNRRGSTAGIQLASLERSGCVEARVSPHRPYLVGAIRGALRAASNDPFCAGDLLTALLLRFGDGTPPATATYRF